MARLFSQPSPELLQDAVGVTARALTDVSANPDAPKEERMRAIGDYMMCCALACDRASPAELFDRLADGLAEAGAVPDIAAGLNGTFRKKSTQRIVFSLSYIPEGDYVRGIIRNNSSKGYYLDDVAFLRGIVERAQTTP